MQPSEGFSVTRRALDVEDYIDIVRRHKGWIFGPFLFCVVASVVGVYLWPDSYTSSALVKITPQQVPQSMVQSTNTQEMYERVMSMQQEIESRGVLTTIINTYDLYKRERARLPIDDVMDQMRKDIIISPAMGANTTTVSRSVPAFSIQFKYSDRYLAQRVVQDLESRFIDASVRNRSNQAFQTTQFMKDEEDTAKKDLDEIENKLTAFRIQNNGRLPDQVQGMMQSLQALQSQVTALDAAISRSNQDKLQLESNLRIVRDRLAELNKLPPPEASAAVNQRNERLAEADREIAQWEDTLRALRQRYSDNYPDVQTAQGRLEGARQKREDILKDDAAKKELALKEEAKKEEARKAGKADASARPENPAIANERRNYETNVKQLQAMIEGKDLEIQEFTKNMNHARESLKTYQARIDSVPLGDKEYNDLLRDQSVARQRYLELEQKLERAQQAQEMETRKQGEMLELLDPASLPITPTEPKRPVVISIGAALGLLLGAMFAGAREMKDTSLKNLKDVRAYTQMAILGSIPLLENDFVVRRRKRLSWLGWTTACLAAVVIMAGSVVYYYVTKV